MITILFAILALGFCAHAAGLSDPTAPAEGTKPRFATMIDLASMPCLIVAETKRKFTEFMEVMNEPSEAEKRQAALALRRSLDLEANEKFKEEFLNTKKPKAQSKGKGPPKRASKPASKMAPSPAGSTTSSKAPSSIGSDGVSPLLVKPPKAKARERTVSADQEAPKSPNPKIRKAAAKGAPPRGSASRDRQAGVGAKL